MKTRRQFLSESLKVLGMAGMSSVVSDLFLTSVINQAFAQTILDTPDVKNSMRYVHLSMPGGPPRWYFDLPLKPTSAHQFEAGGFGNAFQVSGNTVEVVHRAVNTTAGFALPPVWKMPVAGQNFESILKYFTFIRGVDVEINSHALSNARQVAPVIGGYSLTGVHADNKKNPIPGVSLSNSGAGGAFRSKKGLVSSAFTIPSNLTTNLIASILNPYSDRFKNEPIHQGERPELISQVVDQIDQYAKNNKFSRSSAVESLNNASQLILGSVTQMAEQYPALVSKYNVLITEAIHPAKGSLPGFFDKAIRPPATSDKRFLFGNTNTYATVPDFRDAVEARTAAPLLAQQFAALEFLLLSGLTSSIVLGIGGLSGFNFRGTTSVSGVITHDQHNYGSVSQTIVDTLLYRSLLTCLVELIHQLEANSLMDKTLMHIASEFNRSPLTNGAGADHGVAGSNVTLISGKFENASVIGNIKISSGMDSYKGTWGVSAPYALEGADLPIRVNDVARTISAILGCADVTTNGKALMAPNGNNLWVPKLREAKNV